MNGDNPLPNPREKEVFWEALKFSTPEEVAAYLNQACAGDQNLRASVESLLKNHKKEDLSEQLPEKVGEKIGDAIDDYLLLEKIGEGGCGVVFRAQQHKPIQRVVALKVVKREVATGQILERFQAEIQAQASLAHQNIAKVFDAGTTKDGLPYFTMEFVEGKRITDYADKYRLTILERLELFVKVCKTIQFAHEKGFIHRDIKPSNILVYEESGEHIPKVIDFGIAKAIDNGFNAFATRSGQIVGTPAYMSPEQAGMNQAEIDARTDIYSLGVLLYELLAGYQPFDMTGMKLDDAVKTIRERHPKPPSERIKESGDNAHALIAKQRRTDPSQLINALKSDLDRIVMKCLEKNREKRYDLCSSLIASLFGCLKSNSVAKASGLLSSSTLETEDSGMPDNNESIFLNEDGILVTDKRVCTSRHTVRLSDVQRTEVDFKSNKWHAIYLTIGCILFSLGFIGTLRYNPSNFIEFLLCFPGIFFLLLSALENCKITRLIAHCTAGDIILIEFYTLDPSGSFFLIRSLWFGYSKEHDKLNATHSAKLERLESVQAAISKALGKTTIRSTATS